MENRNLSLIIISVTLLFLVVFGVGFFLSFPDKPGEDQSSASIPVEIGRYAGDGEVFAEPLDPAAEDPEAGEGSLAPETDPGNELAGEFDKEAPDVEITGEKDSPGLQEKSFTEPALKDKTNPYEEIHSGLRATKAPTRVQNAPSVKARKPEVSYSYWIQVGSFSKRSGAETRNQKLMEYGYAGQIQTRVVNGTTMYRLRLGPYGSRSEADKFLAWLKSDVAGLDDSYVSAVIR